MSIEYDSLYKLGFTDFIHLKEADRDGQKRMVWMQVIDNEIVTFRIVLTDNKWIIDYVSPNRYSGLFNRTEDLVEYIKSL